MGLPVATAFARAGFRTTGFDIKDEVVRNVAEGKSHVPDVPSSVVAELVDSGKLRATGDRGGTGQDMDAIIICVPTPLGKTGDPDVSHILSAVGDIGRNLRRGQLIVLESTTYPGTTRDLVRPELESGGLRAGEDFFLAFSPERVDPANETFTLANTPKVVGGLTDTCREIAAELYQHIVKEVVRVSSPEAAELTKLLENTFRAVNVALVNEMTVIADRLGIDIWEVVDAASTKPYGFMRFTPGPGLGGHCLPVDPHYLAWKMRTLHYQTRFIELAAEVNAEMPRYVVNRLVMALNACQKTVNGSRVLLLGVAYKPDVGDVRESPALDILELLRDLGAQVAFHDPFVGELQLETGSMYSQPLDAASLQSADAVILVANHRDMDYELVLQHAALILDTRNGFAGKSGQGPLYSMAGPPRPGRSESLEAG